MRSGASRSRPSQARSAPPSTSPSRSPHSSGSPASAWRRGSPRGQDGDRRAFAVLVAACVLASPIVWPNYAALLFVPIAVTWPRLAPVWFFGYVTWLLGAIAPKPTDSNVCCRPADVPQQAWAWSHTEPVLWYALGTSLVMVAVALLVACARPSLRRGSGRRREADGIRASVRSRNGGCRDRRRRPAPRDQRITPSARERSGRLRMSDRVRTARSGRARRPTWAAGVAGLGRRYVSSPRGASAPALWVAAHRRGSRRLTRAAIGLRVPSPWILPDEVVYSELAKSIAAGGRPAVRGVPVFGWGEVYPTLVAPAWAIFDDPCARTTRPWASTRS